VKKVVKDVQKKKAKKPSSKKVEKDAGSDEKDHEIL